MDHRKPPPMTFQERALYHQMHPLKLAADILATPLAIVLCRAWRLFGMRREMTLRTGMLQLQVCGDTQPAAGAAR